MKEKKKAEKTEAYDFAKIEQKWQKEWEKKKVFEVKEDSKKKKFYVLEMFPYPSASGLHMGHAFNYTIGDVYARFKRMQGFNVLYPMGYDAFGLPAENAAIKAKSHPKKFTDEAIANFVRQQKGLGLSYDWGREIITCEPEYYKWNQYFFLKFLENGLAYRKRAAVNWCPKCESVLANEQVHNGRCWRHEDTEVEIKQLEQWFIKTTKYSDELLNTKNLEWPERIKIMQENWIGKSYGTEIDFEIPTESNFIVLHGYGGSSEVNFFPWLKRELEKKGYKVSVPKLPNTDNPNVNEQVKYVLDNCKLDENTVLLGHSLGSVVALKVLESLNKPIKKLILAAGFIEPVIKEWPFVKNFDWKFDFEKIRDNVKEIIILHDTKDKIPREQAEKLKEKLGSKLIYFEAEYKHICGEREPIVLNACLEKWSIFTTRPDTIYGVTFMVVSAQHPRLMELVLEKQKKDVEKFLGKIKSTSEKDAEMFGKEGVFTGSYAVNPLTNERVPVYAGNFVVADYGSGMVMAVPAHDQRDWEFAKKYKIPIKEVIKGGNIKEKAFTGDGILINSGKFSGLKSPAAIEEITKFLESKRLGKKAVNYKFRDWLVSRQRYWGTPIPIVYCEKCGIVPVPEKELPVRLPEKVKFGAGNPLATNKDFVEIKCPRCKGKARRETDTMDTFFDSSWYFLRYCDNKNEKEPFDKKKAEYWMPVDQYIGGAEHACMHLIYARFFTKVLRDFGFVKFDEPFFKLFNQGMLHGNDGYVMSKSRGNGVLPEEASKKYGIDAARLFLMSQAAPDKDTQWSENGIEGSLKLINKIFYYFSSLKHGKSSAIIESKTSKAIKEFTDDIENFRYNLGIIKLRALFEAFENEKEISRKDAESFLKMLHPFCPHIAEELWHKIGNKNFISLESWPKADESRINLQLEKQEQACNNLVGDINNIIKLLREKQNKDVHKVYIYTLPKEKDSYDKELLRKKLNIEIEIYSVADKGKHDPQGKASKAKPGKPAVYAE
ncbi:leucine--tRNA ligase [Candidatus Pacearchaeota archaeon]|nr:leucine--tRNA ligase [Candidatus Pacearchaeota archaeon]